MNKFNRVIGGAFVAASLLVTPVEARNFVPESEEEVWDMFENTKTRNAEVPVEVTYKSDSFEGR